jgi:hypothetical protein
MDIERDSEVLIFIELVQAVPQLNSCVNGLLGSIFQGFGHTEENHDTVTYELVDSATVSFYAIPHHAEAAVHYTGDLLGIELLAHGSEAGDISEHYSGDTALGFNGMIVLAHSNAPIRFTPHPDPLSQVARGLINVNPVPFTTFSTAAAQLQRLAKGREDIDKLLHFYYPTQTPLHLQGERVGVRG